MIPCIWNEAGFFENGIAKVKDDYGNEYKIDTEGRIVEILNDDT